jgi:predicted transcriptional regulator
MVYNNVGRLAVLSKDHKLVGMITRSDLLKAHRRTLVQDHAPEQTLRFWSAKAFSSTARIQ